MKRTFSTFVLAMSIGVLAPAGARAAGQSQLPLTETLCLPGVYNSSPPDCLPLGPSAYLTRQAQAGLSLPLEPLAAQEPDAELARLPFYYAKVNTLNAPVFSSIEDAATKKAAPRRIIEAGLDFVSYLEVRQVEGKKYYLIDPGEWMRGTDLNAGIATSTFVGKQFLRTPERKFGWILFPQESQATPGNSILDFTGRAYTRFDMIQVYASVEVDGFVWHMIGPDEWVQGRHTALVYPMGTPPEGVTNGRWIELNLFEQTIAVYENNQLVYATLTSSGVDGWWTRPGLFQIFQKLESTRMTGSFEADRSDYYYLEDVPWTMYFDEARAFHGTYWHNQFGYERSHGCANLSPGDSQWLFNWAKEGDWVYVWDPSGETPVDPSLYGAGGA
ncbi:MAG: L,D-transpeptidase [Chloroflexi bacterium]|nr:L,D-transpeptidase [Chloroflexota bacterium]